MPGWFSCAGAAGLAQESLFFLARARRSRPRDLDGDGPVEVRVEGLVDGAERAAAQHPQDLELAERCGKQVGRVRGGRGRLDRERGAASAAGDLSAAAARRAWIGLPQWGQRTRIGPAIGRGRPRRHRARSRQAVHGLDQGQAAVEGLGDVGVGGEQARSGQGPRRPGGRRGIARPGPRSGPRGRWGTRSSQVLQLALQESQRGVEPLADGLVVAAQPGGDLAERQPFQEAEPDDPAILVVGEPIEGGADPLDPLVGLGTGLGDGSPA